MLLGMFQHLRQTVEEHANQMTLIEDALYGKIVDQLDVILTDDLTRYRELFPFAENQLKETLELFAAVHGVKSKISKSAPLSECLQDCIKVTDLFYLCSTLFSMSGTFEWVNVNSLFAGLCIRDN
jgi:hypothetical protein